MSDMSKRDPENPAQAAETSLDRGFARDAHAEVTVAEADLLLVDAHFVVRSLGAYLDEVASGDPPGEYADNGE